MLRIFAGIIGVLLIPLGLVLSVITGNYNWMCLVPASILFITISLAWNNVKKGS